MSYKWSDFLCRCGCGNKLGMVSKAAYWRLSKGDPSAGWLKGHRLLGKNNPRYNGHQTINQNGYRKLFRPLHPNSSKSGWILEHRLIMSDHLERPLLRSEIVHHINENKLDNRIENLEITDVRKHYFTHDPNKHKRVVKIPKKCVACGIEYVQKTTRLSNHKRSKFCSKKCRNASGPTHPRRKYSEKIYAAVKSNPEMPRKELAMIVGITECAVKMIRSSVHH